MALFSHSLALLFALSGRCLEECVPGERDLVAQGLNVAVGHVDVEDLLDGDRRAGPLALPDLAKASGTDPAIEAKLLVADQEAALACSAIST